MTPFAVGIIRILSVFTIVADLGILLFVTGMFSRAFKKSSLFSIVQSYGLWLGFIVSLTAALGSYYFSAYIGFAPCDLCWYQRIFLFSQVFIFAVAIYKKDEHVVDYSLVLSVVGAIIAAYHYYGQMFNQSALPCGAAAVSCSKREFIEYGYITIPMMSLTAFATLIVIMISRKLTTKN